MAGVPRPESVCPVRELNRLNLNEGRIRQEVSAALLQIAMAELWDLYWNVVDRQGVTQKT